MDFLTGEITKRTLEVRELKELAKELAGAAQGKSNVISVEGIIHRIREMSDFAFVILRTRRDLIQCVYSSGKAAFNLKDVPEGSCVILKGELIPDERASMGFEIHILNIDVKARPAEETPVVLNKKDLGLSLDTALTYRPITLRHPKERAIFKIQEGVARGFRDYLSSQGFTEIRSPKIVFAGAEGGANIFKLDYFGKQVYLAQSPQFYKQTMVGVYERVFEVAPVYRAERHNTSRHLNEYISMDFEMGFIDSFHDIMNMETRTLKYIVELLKEEYKPELELLNAKLPIIDAIPVIKFMEAKEIISKKYGKKLADYVDFEPEEEQLMYDYAQKEGGSEFIFVTHYPSNKRPFYTMDDKNDPGYTLSFDLLFRGLEITTGGQRVHDYNEQVAKMLSRGMNPEEFETYLMIHKHGIPPHGGLGAGLERITMKLLGLQNVKQASLFPRDIDRVTP